MKYKTFEDYVRELEGLTIDARWDILLHGQLLGDAHKRMADYIAGYQNYIAKKVMEI